MTKKYAVNSAIFQQNRFHNLWSLQRPLDSVGVKIKTVNFIPKFKKSQIIPLENPNINFRDS